jgi:cytochrome P450
MFRRREGDPMPKDMTQRESLPVASLRDRLAFVAEVTAPMLAKGPLIRRPRAVALSERLGLDARAVRRMASLRESYGDGPLLVRIPGRTHVVILSPAHARRVLDETPEPFTPATDEKRAALGHFEPDVSLVSTGAERRERRGFNEAVLENDRPVHSMAPAFLAVVEQEIGRMMREAGGRLDWDAFIRAWYAMVRRVVLGDGAREDRALTDLLETMRARGNWVMLKRKREELLERFRGMVRRHIDRADAGSLAARIAAVPKSGSTRPEDQVAHFLFAFDPGGMASFRALALLAAHPDALTRARDEVRAAGAGEGRAMLPFLRASVLESLRLWPTTPVILRQSTRETEWGGATLPAGANVIVFAPFFHRDPALPFADRFAPELWLQEADAERPVRTAADKVDGAGVALVPFSYGPGRCPASDLVPMLGSAALGAIVNAATPHLADADRLRSDAPMPGVLDNYTQAFRLEPAG